MVHSLLSDVRLGKQINVERVEPVVEQITDSILRINYRNKKLTINKPEKG